MKIVILDGQIEKSDKKWVSYLSDLNSTLKNNNHEVKHFILKDLNIHHCTGCFGCWVKTPGVCVFDDDSRDINREVINSDFVLMASPLKMGFPSYFLKKALDRSIPLIHPYFSVVNGEAHHRARYKKYPTFGLLVQPERNDSENNLSDVFQLFSRTALNLKSRLAFATTTEASIDELINSIEKSASNSFLHQPVFSRKEIAKINPPKRLLIFNGSPRGESGNTPLLLKKITDGFLTVNGNSVEMKNLTQIKEKEKFANDYRSAECVLIGFPLYTDGMPGIVKEFIETLDQFSFQANNPPMAFLVQSGFPEAAHSRYVEKYLQSVAERLKSPYLGTLVRGGIEGVRMMPDSMNKKMFGLLHELGSQLATNGTFNPKTIQSLSGIEKYSPLLIPLFFILSKTPLLQMYWDMQLKDNGVFEQRFAQPNQSINF